MAAVTIEVPEDIWRATSQSPEAFGRDARFLLACALLREGRLSSGVAARLGGLGRVDFVLAAGHLGVPAAHRRDEEISDETGPVVSDAGPIVALAAAGQLSLLGALYGSVLVPDAVFREVVAAGLGRPGAADLRRAPWAIRCDPNPAADPALAGVLGPGEAEAVDLASRRAAVLLTDDLRTRELAQASRGLRVRGTPGILRDASRRGLVPALPPLIEAMRARGYRLSDRVVEALYGREG